MNKKIIFLIIFGILIFGIRLGNLNEAIYDDESNFAYSLTVMDKYGINQDHYSPQPLNLIYKPFIALFGLETWVFRLIPWLFGIINTLFVYIFARRNFGQKVAFFSTFLMLVAFYPTLASLQFDVEGNLVLFSILLMFFSYLEYEKASSNKRKLAWQILAGVGLGLAVVSKYNSIYVVVTLALYSLIKNKWDFKKSFNDLFMIYLVGFVLFLSYVLLGMLANPNNWLKFIWVVGFNRYYGGNMYLLPIGMYVLWSTALLFGFYLLSLFKWDPKNLLYVLWITIPILFYTFVLPFGSLDRYFMNTIPALVILGGFYLAKIKLERKHLFAGSAIFIFYLGILFLINSVPIKYLARLPTLYFNELKYLNLNFLFTYTSASGPTFGINFATIFWSFLIGLGSLFLYLILKKKTIRKWFFTIFLVVSLALNVFLVSEYIFHPMGVDVSEVKSQMVDYVKSSDLAYPIYSNDQGIEWYFHNKYLWNYEKTVGFGDNEVGSRSETAIKNINQRKGTILLLHWPPLPENSPAWEVVDLCKIKKQFYSKEILIGEVYICLK